MLRPASACCKQRWVLSSARRRSLQQRDAMGVRVSDVAS